MACPKCGSIIQDGLTVCPVCHSNIVNEGTNASIQNQVMQTPESIANNPQVANVNSSNGENNKNKKKPLNMTLIFLIILISLIVIIIVLFLTGIIKFNVGSSTSSGGRDIKTVNDNVTSSTKKTKDTTTTTTRATTSPSATSGEEIQVYGDKYVIPMGFEYRDETKNGKSRYLMRTAADAVIAFDLVKGEEITIDSFLATVIETYETNSVAVTVSDLQEKDGYKYYEIVQIDETNKKNIKEHMEVLVLLEDGAIFDGFMLNTQTYGKQNYLTLLFNFIKSREISDTNAITNTKHQFGVAGSEI